MIMFPLQEHEACDDTKEDKSSSEKAVENSDCSDEEDGETEDHPVLRRSTRPSMRPSYLNDYVLVSEVIETDRILLLINEEPWGWDEAKDEKVWREACEEEIASIKNNKTWSLVELPDGCKAIGLKWVFKVKWNADGSINKYKARLVAKG